MNKRISVIMTVLVFLLLTIGVAGAQILPTPQAQVLLPGNTIPKFVSQLPVASTATVPGITVVNAAATPGYNIYMREFQAQILPLGFRGPSSVGLGLPYR